MSRRSAALAASFGTLAVLVAAGALTWLDQWAVDHAMPGFEPGRPKPTLLDGVVPLLHAHWDTTLDVVANVVTLPAQAVISSALAAACGLALVRRGRAGVAGAWAVAWIGGNLVEILCKSTLERPALHAGGVALVGFQSSWPSGHTLRAVLLAALVAATWPATARWAVAWAAATLVLLELAGVHVPSDILGGLLLASLLIAVVRRAASL